MQRHEKLVAEVEAWRRRELLKEQMLIQLSKLQAVEKQRHHFQGRFSAPSHAFLLVGVSVSGSIALTLRHSPFSLHKSLKNSSVFVTPCTTITSIGLEIVTSTSIDQEEEEEGKKKKKKSVRTSSFARSHRTIPPSPISFSKGL